MQKWLLCCLVLGCVGCGEEPAQQRQTKASAAAPQATVALYEQGVAAEQVGDAAGAFSAYEQAANQGYAPAVRALAQCYELGIGCDAMPKRAFNLYQQLHEQGDAEAGARLGIFYFHGVGVEKDERRALQYYQASAERGSVFAAILVANCHELGFGTAQDSAEAFRRYKALFDRGESVTKNFLYVAYLPDNQQGYLTGMESIALLVARCYRMGIGVAQDLDEAVKYYRVAAKSGDFIAQFALGRLYAERGHFSEAVTLYQAAEAAGLTAATYELARCYEQGLGVVQNQRYAFELYQWITEEGQFRAASFALARCYEYGIGTQRSPQLALHYYTIAANLDYLPAQMLLAHYAEEGKGGQVRDLQLARKYYEMVVKNELLDIFMRQPEALRERRFQEISYLEQRDLGYSVIDAAQRAKAKLD